MSVNAPNQELGWKAPDFKLLSTDDKFYSIDDLKGNKGTVIAFICNHCPYVIKIADRLSKEAKELSKIEVSTVAIMSNDVLSYPEDSFENMKLFSKKFNFCFPYLYDESQNVARMYGAVCTPDIFGFNKDKVLNYRGRIDSEVINDKETYKRELFDAMTKIVHENIGPEKQFNSFGCSIKWKKDE